MHGSLGMRQMAALRVLIIFEKLQHLAFRAWSLTVHRSVAKKFPCPYCKGQGSWVEPVLDYGEGPSYDCGACRGEGMIEIDGPIHKKIKEANAWRKSKLNTL